MRGIPAVALVALFLSGCFLPPNPPEAGPFLVREAFDAPQGELSLVLGGGCGMCPGWQGFDNGSESFVLALFADGRIVRADVNGGWGNEGEKHVYANVTFDRAHLLGLLAPSDRARGETWVLRVLTARLADPAEAARLRAMWRAHVTGQDCTDAGFDLSIVHAGEPALLEHATYSCPPETGPMHDLSERLFQIARAMPANASRQGAAGESTWG